MKELLAQQARIQGTNMVKKIPPKIDHTEKVTAQHAATSAKIKSAKDDESSKVESLTKKRKMPMVRK